MIDSIPSNTCLVAAQASERALMAVRPRLHAELCGGIFDARVMESDLRNSHCGDSSSWRVLDNQEFFQFFMFSEAQQQARPRYRLGEERSSAVLSPSGLGLAALRMKQ